MQAITAISTSTLNDCSATVTLKSGQAQDLKQAVEQAVKPPEVLFQAQADLERRLEAAREALGAACSVKLSIFDEETRGVRSLQQ